MLPLNSQQIIQNVCVVPEKTPNNVPTWAPRVSRAQIGKFYRVSGRGIIDEEIIDDLGISLYARCESILLVMEAMRERRVTCPNCEATVHRNCDSNRNETLACAECDWKCEWQDYRSTFDEKFLNAGGMKQFCLEFVKKYRAARTYGEKIVLIDTLIHRCHGELTGGKQPGAYAFIEGEPHDTAAFLDRLNYGDQVPEEIRIRRKKWRERVRAAPTFWSDQLKPDPADETGKDTD